MPDILLFGATGYTGRLTATALARRGANFAIAGRNKAKLYELADETNGPEVRIASVGNVDALVAALGGVKVMITCVGPFTKLGHTAAEAALRARVHYIDSTGEGTWIGSLRERDADARAAGICMAPSMGFDEVPADVAATLATEGMQNADLTLTYAVPTVASKGTIRSVLGIITEGGEWLTDGQSKAMRAGEAERWAPLPAPFGPKRTVAMPIAEARLAPMHLDLNSARTFVTAGTLQRLGIRFGLPLMGAALGTSWGAWTLERALAPLPEGPNEEQRARGKWTLLAEASAGEQWRNVVVTGTDVYGLTAEFLTAGALRMLADDFTTTGVRAPVDAVGLETLHKELLENDVSIDTYEPRP